MLGLTQSISKYNYKYLSYFSASSSGARYTCYLNSTIVIVFTIPGYRKELECDPTALVELVYLSTLYIGLMDLSVVSILQLVHAVRVSQGMNTSTNEL